MLLLMSANCAKIGRHLFEYLMQSHKDVYSMLQENSLWFLPQSGDLAAVFIGAVCNPLLSVIGPCTS